jgi:hypothetical protein
MKTKSKSDRTKLAYWASRIYQPTYKNSLGKMVANTDWYVTLCLKNEVHRIFLQTHDRDLAAKRALEAYFFLRTNGWEETLEKYRVRKVPQKSREEADPSDFTVGDFLRDIHSANTIGDRVFKIYARSFRRVVAKIFCKEGKRNCISRKDAEARDLAADGIVLSELTGELVEGWQRNLLEEKVAAGVPKSCAITTINGILRNAKSLFSKKNIRKINRTGLKNPFEYVFAMKEGSHRYVSRMNPKDPICKIVKIRDSWSSIQCQWQRRWLPMSENGRSCHPISSSICR